MTRIYIAAPADCDLTEIRTALTVAGWDVANGDETTLRDRLAALTTCEALCLEPTWWTSNDAHALQHVAGWLRMTFIDGATLQPMETTGRKL